MRAYLKMLPRLQAEEQIAAVRTAALGAGTYPAGDQERLLRELDRRAGGDRPRVKKARPADLAAMGIGIIGPVPETSQAGVNDV